MHAERPPNKYASIQSNNHQNNFKIKLIDDADVVRERYDMANEDNLSMAVERRYLDEYFKDRLYSLPASFPVLKQQIIDMPVFEVDEIDNLGDGIMLGQIPLFDQSAVVRIQVLDDDPLKLLRAPHEAIKKLNIYKQRIMPENSLLNDKILNKALKDEKITEVLARISPISSSKTSPPVTTHHQIPSWRPTLLSMPHFLRTQLQHICRHASNTGIYSSAQLSSMTASSIYIDMHASACFSPQLISRSIDDLECDGMLTRYSMKLEEVGEFTMLDRLANRSIHIVSATLNGMTAISSTVSLTSCTNLIDIVDLNLGHNHLQKFEALGVLKKLRILNLESNKITRISPLKSDTLIKLCLANNQISIIKHLDGLPHLKDLDLSGNMITAINKLDGLPMLEVLDMSRNRLQRVSGLHLNTMLTKAVLYGNQISAIDDWDSIFLEDLSLSENSLTSIDFKLRCPRLQTVNLRSNRLTSIRYAATWSVGRLTSLQLAYNPLQIQDIISCCSSFVSLTDLVFTAESDMDTRAVVDKLDKVLPRLRIINELRIGPKTFENNQMLEKLLLRVSEFGFSGDQGSGFDFLCRQEYKSARPMQRLNYLLDTLNQLQNRNHFLWRLIPSAEFVKQRLSKFIKLCPMPKRKLIYDLMPAILKGETSFRTSLLTSTKDLAKIEQESKIKLSKVRKFLLNVMQRRRERKRFLATKTLEIVTIQKNLRGWLSRRLWSHKRDPLYFHKNHINKIIACQKLIRGMVFLYRLYHSS